MFSKIVLLIFRVFKKIGSRLRLFYISLIPGIAIRENVRIGERVRIDTVYGGTIEIGDCTELLDGVLILTYGGSIKIGKNCSINPYCIIYGHGGVTIGNHVLIAAGTMVIPSNHMFDNPDKNIREQGSKSRGIVIEDDVWIGHGCSILDGVTIGRGSVIAAGSVVNKSIEPFSVVAGVPAKMIKNRR